MSLYYMMYQILILRYSANSLTTVKFCEETDKNGDKWREFGGKCYQVNPLPFNWWEARKKCAEKDANLVSIHSRQEKDFLIELVQFCFVHCFVCFYFTVLLVKSYIGLGVL